MLAKLLAAALFALAAVLAILLLASGGHFGSALTAGEVTAPRVSAQRLAARDAAQSRAATGLGASQPGQILFGDLHVHSSFSTDAFQLTLPMSGGDGVHPVADACDFARHCAGLDFWSINDHAASLDARRWRETVRALRQCEAVAGGPEPDLVSFLGWEWTQMGSTPDNHYGHKNVVLRDLDEIPSRPIAARPPAGVPSSFSTGAGGRLARGVGAFLLDGGHDMMRTLAELGRMEPCDLEADIRSLPDDCRDAVETPGELFTRLDAWGLPALVIPHGTTWGMYTPAGSSIAKQLSARQHDAERQRLVEVYSGHGSAEEYRPYRATRIEADGARRCPEPSPGYLPTCWRAGEIIEARCLEAGLAARDCAERAEAARENFVRADRNAGPWTVPGVEAHDWLDAGQCRDCFQPAFNHRPLGSVQYMLALTRPGEPPEARRFRLGFIAASDNHTARAGTGYKEAVRREFTDARMGEVGRSPLVAPFARPPQAESEPFDPAEAIPSVAFLETERGGSFFLTGGLAAVHAVRRDRDAIWSALERRATYATSGPRILLWFELLDPNAPSGAWPMGSEVRIAGTPTFRVRAIGSFEQQPGCPGESADALGPERLAYLCRGECYHPSDRRRPITRIEVVRIQPQRDADDPVGPLIEDPWRVLACDGDPAGCETVFSDPDFASAARDTLYYVRAIEAPAPTVGADPLGCERDAAGACVSLDPCFDRPDDDDCLAPSEPRAWSSPIYVDHRASGS